MRWLTLLKHPSSSLLQISEQPWRCCCREGTAPPAAPFRSRESCNDIDPKKKNMEKIKWNQNGSFQKWSFPPTTPSKIKDKQLNNPIGWDFCVPWSFSTGGFLASWVRNHRSADHIFGNQILVAILLGKKRNNVSFHSKGIFFRPPIFCPHPKNEKQKKQKRKHTVHVMGEEG